jgi:cytochrome P450
MTSDDQGPARITGLAALRGFVRFLSDPVAAMQAAHAAYGPFVLIASPIPIGTLRRLTAMTAGARFNREVLSDPVTWGTIHIMAVGKRDTAERRVGIGLISMRGPRHAYYRKLIAPPLRKPKVENLGEDMARLAEEVVDRWPVGTRFDLWSHVRGLMQAVSIGLLFGDDRKQGDQIAELINKRIRFKWTFGALACPFNLPITPYGRMVRQSEALERRLTAWADCKRGRLNDRDLLSIIVNNPDENGKPPSQASITGQVPTLFGATYETCQTALIWTLVLLSQHPRIGRDLADELQGRLAGAPPTLDRLQDLPLLVPMQFRVAQRDTVLGGHPVPIGTRAMLSSFLTNRTADLYPEADRFKPERWATINPSVYEYSAFSAGPRICPGIWFGVSVLKVALAAILSRYRVALQPGVRIDYDLQVTLAPRAAVPATLHPPDGAFTSAPLRGRLTELVRFPQ